ncbi:MAG: hypothetical protein IIU39_00365 [Ruminococcus sp.]|nr:hypothetical protein [Ruminococcus sp.]
MAVIKYFIERRIIRVIFSNVHNATGGISTGCKISLPKKWMDLMGVSNEDRRMCVDFDPERKTILLRKADACNKIIIPKSILKDLGVKSNCEFSVDFITKNNTITLTSKEKNDGKRRDI